MPRRRRAAAAPETRPAGSLWNAGADEPSSAALRARVRPPPARKVDCRPPHGARKSAAALLDAVDFPGTNSTADFLQSSSVGLCKVFGAAQLPDALAAGILASTSRCLCSRRAQRRQHRAPSAAAPVLQWRRMPHRRRRQSLPIHPLDARSMTGFARRPLVRRPRCASSAALPGRNASL